MAYNSAYTGPQVDAVVGAVREKESAWDGKQDKLNGTEDQIVGFNASGDAVPVAPPDTGVTTFNGRAGAVLPSENDYSADMIKFSDGQSFQQKYNDGQLTGPQGKQGPPGNDGADGQQGPAGAAATINGVNALTLNATGGINGSQSGSTYTINGSGKVNKPTRLTAVLSSSGWSGNSQTITVNGVVTDTSAQDIDISCADKASADAWAAGGVWCSNPTTANQLTFTCTTPPTANINLNIRLWEVG